MNSLAKRLLKLFNKYPKSPSADHYQLYFNYFDLSAYLQFWEIEPNDVTQELKNNPTINICFFNAKTRVKEVKKKLGKPTTEIEIDTLKGLKIIHYKKLVNNGIKEKYNFHFYNDELIFYSEVFPYLKQKMRKQIFNQFMLNQDFYHDELTKKIIFSYQKSYVIVENSVDLRFHYFVAKKDSMPTFQKARDEFLLKHSHND